MTMKKASKLEAEQLYAKALEKRMRALNTKHSYSHVQQLAEELREKLKETDVEQAASVGIGIKDDKSDLMLVVHLLSEKLKASVPEDIDGLEVKKIVVGEVKALE